MMMIGDKPGVSRILLPWRNMSPVLISIIRQRRAASDRLFSRSLNIKHLDKKAFFLLPILFNVKLREQRIRDRSFITNRPSFPCYLTVFENRSINHQQPVESRSSNLARGPSKWTVRKKLQIMINLIVFRIQVRLQTLAAPCKDVCAARSAEFIWRPLWILGCGLELRHKWWRATAKTVCNYGITPRMKTVYTFIHHNTIWDNLIYLGSGPILRLMNASLFLPDSHFGYCQETQEIVFYILETLIWLIITCLLYHGSANKYF